jgi:hypothetical protein
MSLKISGRWPLPLLKMIEFTYQEIMCSNGYIINIDRSNILVNKLHKLYVMASNNMVLNNLLVPLVY